MFSKNSRARVGSIIAGGLIFCGAPAANAGLIFDNINLPGSVSTRSAGSSPGAQIVVGAANITINQIAVRNDLNSNGNLKFLIFDHTNHALLFDSGPKAFVDNGMSLKMSDLFSFTLLAGNTYDIGAIADVGGLWGYDTTGNSQGGLTSVSTNPNFSDFANPAAGNHASADGHIQLFTSVQVPEPGTLALFGLGLAGLGFVRRRKTATRRPV